MAATAALARYDLEKGVLNLTGSEPGAVKPHVVNDKISVDATVVDLTLTGPKMLAKGAVKSVLQPAQAWSRRWAALGHARAVDAQAGQTRQRDC